MLRLWFGGTFDPVHNGHLAIARAARDELGVAVRLMPAADPPHRTRPGADAAARAHMLALAIGDEPGLAVDRRELDRPGPSYSIDTVRSLRAEYGADSPLALLLGADSFLSLPTWHEWTALFGQVHLVVADRPGSPLEGPMRQDAGVTPGTGGLPAALAAAVAGRWRQDPAALAATPAGCLYRLHQPLTPESATEVRSLIAHGGDWPDRVPSPVAAFIRAHGLYTGRGYNARTPC